MEHWPGRQCGLLLYCSIFTPVLLTRYNSKPMEHWANARMRSNSLLVYFLSIIFWNIRHWNNGECTECSLMLYRPIARVFPFP